MTSQRTEIRRGYRAAAVFAMLVAAAGAASAQSAAAAGADEAQIPEVLVTAERTTSLASKTPVTMTTLSGAQLRSAGIDSPGTLGARIPGVQLDGANDGLRITIRGVSSADTSEKGDPSAAFMLDGTYIARPQIQNVSFFDLARIEVLRGPQGTLYGRNTTAGVVNVISNVPGPKFEAEVGAELGNYNARKAEAMLNVPVGSALALRIALAYNKHDSYLINGQGTGYSLGLDRDDLSARLSALWRVIPDATLLLRFDHGRYVNSNDSIVPASNFYANLMTPSPTWIEAGSAARLTNGFVPFNAPLQQGFGHSVTHGVGVELNWSLGAVDLIYLGSHRSFDDDHLLNFHYQLTPVAAIGVREAYSGAYRQHSHEVRLATSGSGPFKAQAGVYYFREASDLHAVFRDLELIGLPPYYDFTQGPIEALSKAVFGQATYGVSERLRLTAGVRVSRDHKSRFGTTNFQQGPLFNPATDFRTLNAADLNTNKTIWRLGADMDLAPGSMVYASVATGYKAGGFNDGCLAGASYRGTGCPSAFSTPASALFYQPESLRSYEGGIKTKFWGNRASVNASAFYYDYTNLQLSSIVIIQGAPRFTTTNAANASVKGLEVEGLLLATPMDKVSYSLALLDAQYENYKPDGATSWTGKKLDRSPGATATVGYDHTFVLAGGKLKAGVFSRTSGAYRISVPSQLTQYRVPGRRQSDANLSYRPDGSDWSVEAFVKNLEKTVVPISIDSVAQTTPSDPQTFGVRLVAHF
jgi:iron complex outermembrane receptor protein